MTIFTHYIPCHLSLSKGRWVDTEVRYAKFCIVIWVFVHFRYHTDADKATDIDI